MKMSIWLSKMAGKHAEVRLLKLVLLGLLICTVVNTYILQRALATRHTVLIPAGGITEELSIQNDLADDKYLRVMLNYIMNLMGNYTPASARKNFEVMLQLYEPAYYPKALEVLLELADDVEYSGATSSFGIEKITYKGGRELAEVKGWLRQYIDDRMVERREATYLVYYAVKDGRFFLRGIEEQGKETKR